MTDADSLPTVSEVDDRVAELLGQFTPEEIVHRRRAEDLVASALTMYAAALRRLRTLSDLVGDPETVEAWSEQEPLASLLTLHLADTPTPPPVDDDALQRATGCIDRILGDLVAAPDAVAVRTAELFGAVAELHEAGFAQLMGFLDERLRPAPAVLDALVDDRAVTSVLTVHGLHPVPLGERVGAQLDELRAAASPLATIELCALDGNSLHLRVTAARQADAHRLRLHAERLLAERLPDLDSITIDGGDEPQAPTTVHIPLESVTVRRSSTDAVDSP